MRSDLRGDPAVIAIMAKTGLDEFAVIGRLHKLWSWADAVSEDGVIGSLSPVQFVSYMDRELASDGFISTLYEVGWLTLENDRVVFPNYDRHMSESAKKRSVNAARKAESRSQKKRTNVRKKVDKSGTRGEEIREEKNIPPVSPPEGDIDPFDTFWSIFPKHRRVKKPKAKAAWKKHVKPPLVDTVLAALRQDVSSEDWQRDNGAYVPHPTTWLNQHRWEDEDESPVDGAVPLRRPGYSESGLPIRDYCERCKTTFWEHEGHQCASGVAA